MYIMWPGGRKPEETLNFSIGNEGESGSSKQRDGNFE